MFLGKKTEMLFAFCQKGIGVRNANLKWGKYLKNIK